MQNLAELVRQAVAELGIEGPILRIDQSASGNGLDLWPAGADEPLTWEPPAPAKKSAAGKRSPAKKKATAKEK